MGIMALSLELSLCWELLGLDAGVNRELPTNGNDEEDANERLVRAVCNVCIGGFRAAVYKRPVAAFDSGGLPIGLIESQIS